MGAEWNFDNYIGRWAASLQSIMVKHRLWSLSSPGYGFSSSHVWMWELDHKESGAPKTWCFKQWCWKRLFRVPWTSRRSNQSILKEISPEDSLEGLMQKLQYFGHKLTHLKRPWCWATLEGKEDSRGWDGLHHRLNGHEFEQAPEVGDGQGSLACCSPWVAESRQDWVTELRGLH